jgi:hypothetical protein
MALQMEDRSSDYVLWVQRQMDQPDATAEPPGEGPAPASDGTAAD